MSSVAPHFIIHRWGHCSPLVTSQGSERSLWDGVQPPQMAGLIHPGLDTGRFQGRTPKIPWEDSPFHLALSPVLRSREVTRQLPGLEGQWKISHAPNSPSSRQTPVQASPFWGSGVWDPRNWGVKSRLLATPLQPGEEVKVAAEGTASGVQQTQVHRSLSLPRQRAGRDQKPCILLRWRLRPRLFDMARDLAQSSSGPWRLARGTPPPPPPVT